MLRKTAIEFTLKILWMFTKIEGLTLFRPDYQGLFFHHLFAKGLPEASVQNPKLMFEKLGH